MNAVLAVVIATKDRHEAIEKYALSSLGNSDFRDFVCVVWDAGEDDKTRVVVEATTNLNVIYRRAPRGGSASQRNDAVEFVLERWENIRWIVFMDDDCALSPDALGGIVETFRDIDDAAIVNLPMKACAPLSAGSRFMGRVKRRLGMNRHGATAFLYNYGADDETPGEDAEWASGGGMAVDVSIFKEDRVFFPEAFQRFGGYALGEDFAFSFFVFKKLRRRIVNSLRGCFLHYAAGSARLDIARMAASKWHNFHLLFDAVYDDVRGIRRVWLRIRFKLFMCAAAVKLLFRVRSCDVPAVLRGVGEARAALSEYRAAGGAEQLFQVSGDCRGKADRK